MINIPQSLDIMDKDSATYFNGRVLKPTFAFCFDNLVEEINHNIRTIPTRVDSFEQPPLNNTFNATDWDWITDDCIYNLYTFRAGVQFLMQHLDELNERGLLMYMFSSPFIEEDELLKLLLSPLILENCQDCFLDHLAKNPNIYQD